MSLVERALKKIQESRTSVPQPQAPSAQAPIEKTPLTPRTSRRQVHEPGPAPQAAAPVVPTRSMQIDRAALRAEGIFPPQDEERQFAAEYRQIKRPLIAGALGRGGAQMPNGHLIMVTSALAGEGKTFTSINLALSMAHEKDVSVLLVDADVAKPRLSTLLGLKHERGLLDLLRNESLDIDSVILGTDVPQLSVLPVGTNNEMATELLASPRMEQIVSYLGAASNRIVLFDSPPLLLTSESRVLATVVGNVTMVVRAGSTPQEAVLHALDVLGEGRPVSLVLNQCDESAGTAYYQYYGPRPDGPEPAA